jgi:hypothetical protein
MDEPDHYREAERLLDAARVATNHFYGEQAAIPDPAGRPSARHPRERRGGGPRPGKVRGGALARGRGNQTQLRYLAARPVRARALSPCRVAVPSQPKPGFHNGRRDQAADHPELQ